MAVNYEVWQTAVHLPKHYVRPKDLFTLYILISQSRPADDILENSSFETCSFYASAHVRKYYGKQKENSLENITWLYWENNTYKVIYEMIHILNCGFK